MGRANGQAECRRAGREGQGEGMRTQRYAVIGQKIEADGSFGGPETGDVQPRLRGGDGRAEKIGARDHDRRGRTAAHGARRDAGDLGWSHLTPAHRQDVADGIVNVFGSLAGRVDVADQPAQGVVVVMLLAGVDRRGERQQEQEADMVNVI